MTSLPSTLRTSLATISLSLAILLGGCTAGTLTGPDVEEETTTEAPAVRSDDNGSTRPHFEHNLHPSRE